MTILGCLFAIIIVILAIFALICGVIVELFWPVAAVIVAYYLIRWLKNNSGGDNKNL